MDKPRSGNASSSSIGVKNKKDSVLSEITEAGYKQRTNLKNTKISVIILFKGNGTYNNIICHKGSQDDVQRDRNTYDRYGLIGWPNALAPRAAIHSNLNASSHFTLSSALHF